MHTYLQEAGITVVDTSTTTWMLWIVEVKAVLFLVENRKTWFYSSWLDMSDMIKTHSALGVHNTPILPFECTLVFNYAKYLWISKEIRLHVKVSFQWFFVLNNLDLLFLK